nr:hypothetical protein [Heyndrickxia oleronia]
MKRLEKVQLRRKQNYFKKSFDQSKSYIDKKKQSNELALYEELKAWERVQSRYKKGTKEREEADENYARTKKEISDKLISIDEEYLGKVQDINQKLIDGEKALRDEYNKKVEDRTNALANVFGTFEEFSITEDVTIDKVLHNMQSQVDGLSQWIYDINALASKNIDKGLLDELRQLGVKSAAQINALNNMTSDQLDQFEALWKQKNQLARQQAVHELEGLKQDTEIKIDELHKNSAQQLEKLKQEWTKKIKEIRNGTTGEFNAMNASMNAIGQNAIKGLMNGLAAMQSPLMKQAKDIANSVSSTISKVLKIHSPSRVMMELGEFTGQGYAIGIEKMKGTVAKASELLSNNVVSGIKLADQLAKNRQQLFQDGLEMSVRSNQIIQLNNTIELDGYEIAKNQAEYINDMQYASTSARMSSMGVRR